MKLSDTQQKAIEIVQQLVKDEKISFSDAFALIVAIYEKEKEYVYIPTQPYEPKPWTTEPWCPWPNTPWYERPGTITCQTKTPDNANSSHVDMSNPKYWAYLTGNTPAAFMDYVNGFTGWNTSATH